MLKSLSSFNKDYEVYSKRIEPEKRWLFMNQTTSKAGESVYELENYVREDPAFPKRGEILWRCKYDEHPQFVFAAIHENGSCEFQSKEDCAYGGRPVYSHGGELRKDFLVASKYRMETDAICTSVKVQGFEYKASVSSRGWLLKECKYWKERVEHRDKDGKVVRVTHEERHSTTYNQKVVKISYKIFAKDGSLLDEFDLNNGSDVHYDHSRNTISSKVFDASFEKVKTFLCFSTITHKIQTKEGVDPGFCLIFGHICCTEFGPQEIENDLCSSRPF